jgi:hypothetical protein
MVDHTIYGGYPNMMGNPYYGYQRPQVYQNTSSTIIFVKGIDEAKQYPQVPGTTLILWDSEVDVFYRKSTDSRGNVIEFEICDYRKREIKEESKDESQNEIIANLSAQVKELATQIEGMRKETNHISKKQGGVNNGKPNV